MAVTTKLLNSKITNATAKLPLGLPNYRCDCQTTAAKLPL